MHAGALDGSLRRPTTVPTSGERILSQLPKAPECEVVTVRETDRLPGVRQLRLCVTQQPRQAR
jgi:hypothetical protein